MTSETNILGFTIDILEILESQICDQIYKGKVSRSAAPMWPALRIWWTDPRIIHEKRNVFGSDPVRLVLALKIWFRVMSGLYEHIGRHSDRCRGQNHPLADPGHLDRDQDLPGICNGSLLSGASVKAGYHYISQGGLSLCRGVRGRPGDDSDPRIGQHVFQYKLVFF